MFRVESPEMVVESTNVSPIGEVGELACWETLPDNYFQQCQQRLPTIAEADEMEQNGIDFFKLEQEE